VKLALLAFLASSVQLVLLVHLVRKASSVRKAVVDLRDHLVQLGQLDSLVWSGLQGSMVNPELLDFQDRLATQEIRVVVVHRVQLDLSEPLEALDQLAPLEQPELKESLDHKETLAILVLLDLTEDKASLV